MDELSINRETPRSVDLAAVYPDVPPDVLPDEQTLNSPLGAWFHELIDVPFDEWTDFDVARAMRQDMYIEQVVPRALAILKEEPFAGAWSIGEVLKSFTDVPPSYWENHPDQKQAVVEAAKNSQNDPLFDYVDDEMAEIIRWMVSGTIPDATKNWRGLGFPTRPTNPPTL